MTLSYKWRCALYVNITEDEVVNEAFGGLFCLETHVHTIFRDACRSDSAWRPWTLRALQFGWPLQNVCRLRRTSRPELQAPGFGAGCSSHFSAGCHVWLGPKVPGHRLACCNLAVIKMRSHTANHWPKSMQTCEQHYCIFDFEPWSFCIFWIEELAYPLSGRMALDFSIFSEQQVSVFNWYI